MSLHIVLSIVTYLYAFVDFSFIEIPECQDYLFEVSTENTSGDEDNGYVEIKLVGTDIDTRYHFHTIDRELLSFEFENNSIKGLKKGEYYCLVVVAGECYKKLDFRIL